MPLIILAEDDPFVAELVCAALEREGHTVGVLPDGRGIVDVIKTKRPALVILDCAMPVMGGIQALQLIRSSTIGFSVPVLMLTARASIRDEEIARRAGATNYLRKPFDVDELGATVECLISDASNAKIARERPLSPNSAKPFHSSSNKALSVVE